MPPSVPEVIGANARKLRLDAGVTLDQFAQSARFCGLSAWTTGRVGDFEAGRVAPSLPTIYAVALALQQSTGRPVTIADLLAHDGRVRINDGLVVQGSELQDAMKGAPVVGHTERDSHLAGVMDEAMSVMITRTAEWKRLPKWVTSGLDPHTWLQVEGDLREADLRMCRSIGLDRDFGAALMVKLWNCSFCTERDLRAGLDANAQRKGQVSRQLKTELLQAIGEQE